jgi:hypothetical protein
MKYDSEALIEFIETCLNAQAKQGHHYDFANKGWE